MDASNEATIVGDWLTGRDRFKLSPDLRSPKDPAGEREIAHLKCGGGEGGDGREPEPVAQFQGVSVARGIGESSKDDAIQRKRGGRVIGLTW